MGTLRLMTILLTILLVIASFLLVVVTGFFTFNLNRIAVYDKRYKIYESLIKLSRNIKGYKDVDIRRVSELFKATMEENNVNTHQAYKCLFGDDYDDFVYNIESSRFLFDDEIYKFLQEIDEQAKIMSNFFVKFLRVDMFVSDVSDASLDKAVKYFVNASFDKITLEKFYPYLKFEEDIFKWYLKPLHKILAVFSCHRST